MSENMTPRELAKRIERGEKWKLAESDHTDELAGLPDTAPEALRRFRTAITGHALTVGEKGAVLIALDKCADELERLARENAEFVTVICKEVEARERAEAELVGAGREIEYQVKERRKIETELAAVKRRIAEAPVGQCERAYEYDGLLGQTVQFHGLSREDQDKLCERLERARVALLPVGGEG